MALAIVDLADNWAVRELTLRVRSLAALRPSARQLVDALRAT